MNLEEMEPKHAEALKAVLSESDKVIDVQMVGYLDMCGDGSRSYIVYMHDSLEKCLVLSKFEYYITKKIWILSDEKIWKEDILYNN